MCCNHWLKMWFYTILILLLRCYAISSFEHGVFWHLSDLHVDQDYSRSGNPQRLCHSENGQMFPDNGMYGNYFCDAPIHLINVTVAVMKQIHPKPDFIIWTGDNLPHVDTNPDWDVIFESIRNTTQLLVSLFPEVPILPSIGNHDTFPLDTVPAEDASRTIYKGYLDKGGWDELILKEAWPTFLQGGYFSQLVKPRLRILSLNTILWDALNDLTKDIADPGNQFKWMEEVLKNSSTSSEKVYLIGHIAAGFYSRVIPGQKGGSTYHPHHLEAFNNILNKHSEIIIGQMYGHYHVDMFTISRYNTGFYKGSSLIVSSVTPAHNGSKFNGSLPVNPSVRLMHFSLEDASLLDYDQFYLNLTMANGIKETSEEHESLLYRKLYTFTEFYKVQDLSTLSLVDVYEKLVRDPDLFNSFYVFLTAGEQTTICDDNCKVA